MVITFPFPYENESIYSLFARFHEQSGSMSIKRDFSELFGESRVLIATDLPTGLESLFGQINHYEGDITTDLISRNTPFNYFTNFLSLEKRGLIRLCMLEFESVNKIHLITGQVASTIKEQTYFQFCDKCLMEDYDSFGETYWRVNHQLPGVYYCIKHRKILSVSTVLYRQRYSRLIGANFENCILSSENNVLTEELNKSESELLIKVAEESVYLNIHNLNLSNVFLQKYYFRMLELEGYTTPNGRIKQVRLTEDFIEFYGVKLLTLLQSLPDKQCSYNWLSCIVRKHHKSFHPLRHILLTLFLNQSFSNLKINTLHEKSFFPCRNPAASHYNKKCAYLKRKKKDKKGQLIGTISCGCGYEYIVQISKSLDGNFVIGRVTNFGAIWEKELLRLKDVERLSFRKISELLQADVKTIINKYQRLKSESLNEAHSNDNVINKIDGKNWIKAQEVYPMASRSKLRKLYPALYMRLYRKNKEWLLQNSPETVCAKSQPRVDWNKRDLAILMEIKEYILWLRKTSQIKRITVKELGVGIKNLSMLEKNLHKLPNTAMFLKVISEDHFEFKIKKEYFKTNSIDL